VDKPRLEPEKEEIPYYAFVLIMVAIVVYFLTDLFTDVFQMSVSQRSTGHPSPPMPRLQAVCSLASVHPFSPRQAPRRQNIDLARALKGERIASK